MKRPFAAVGFASRCLVPRSSSLGQPDTLRPWGRIVELYSKAVERGHWKAMHNLANLYRTGWPGGVEKDTQKALDLYQKMIDLGVPQGFYNMGAMIGNRAGVKNPATDGLTFLDKAASMGNPPALTALGKLYIYEANQDELGLRYTQCAAEQGYAPANYELGAYYKIVKHNYPKALSYYQLATSQGDGDAALLMTDIFDEKVDQLIGCGMTRIRSFMRCITLFTRSLKLIQIYVLPT